MSIVERLSLLATAGVAVAALGCTMSDSERCDEGQIYKDGECVEPDTDSETAGGTDSGDPDGGGELPSGMGETCGSDADCQGFEADYCLIEYGEEEGVCTVKNCSIAPDDCPGGYGCCDFSIDGVPNFCATDQMLEDLGDMCES